MYSQEEICHDLKLLDNITEPRRGIHPGFNKGHVLLLLKYLHQRNLSRSEIEEKLDLTEASVKTMVKRLKEKEIVNTSKFQGTFLTDKGRLYSNKILTIVKIITPSCHPLNQNDMLIMVPEILPPKTIVGVHNIRDYLVKSMCNLSLIGGLINGKVIFPGVSKKYIRTLTECLEQYDKTGIFIFVPFNKLASCVNGIVNYILEEYCVNRGVNNI